MLHRQLIDEITKLSSGDECGNDASEANKQAHSKEMNLPFSLEKLPYEYDFATVNLPLHYQLQCDPTKGPICKPALIVPKPKVHAKFMPPRIALCKTGNFVVTQDSLIPATLQKNVGGHLPMMDFTTTKS